MAAGRKELSETQAETIAFLSEAATHGGVPHVERIETHGNIIFLAGPTAWKIKRAVRFPYMDFSTVELRHRACLEEMAVNARLAPALYIGCVPITREPSGHLAIAGDGVAVEWAVKMHRFAQEDLLSARAAVGPIPQALATAVADAVHASHRGAQIHAEARGADRIGAVLDNLSRALRDLGSLDAGLVESFARGGARLHARAGALLDRRAQQGCVRRCHGDLHAANIVIWNGQPLLYDAIEFDPDLATIDTLYDLSFLLMDLDRRGQRQAANDILNRYLWLGRDDLDLDGLAALPLFMGLRAGIRALVTAERAQQQPEAAAGEEQGRSAALLRAAAGYLVETPPVLIAVAGLSGTGKSTLARRLSPWLGPAPGAVHLRSDLIRKGIAGVGATERLPAESYTPEASVQVYGELARQARLVLAAGRSVVADAVCARPHEREMLRRLAQACGVAFSGLWLAAPPEVLLARVAQRTHDASDATASVVRTQLDWQTQVPGEGWTPVDAGGTPEATLEAARGVLGGLISHTDTAGSLP
ncbi:MAG: AAA family ATPase [Hyphomicrobiaceae bacterium]|nr:AAA family ATPase [Hyphomicrobiaceae bacterium]